ncbi:PKS-NRPS hybrid synthetase CHGG_01239-like [Camellia sinensis]|uniref:PKS-NRPS hybrid synthetase CHGG_01239-like n=2 Tax=Camellia sinensis TaxID=4442 RepID=UPI001036CA75|nr:PKS-NRPS hybrid synthetase CHGG_01239-like [Camellia sinensis]
MDCTYKTNRYRLPLLEIVGVTSTEMTFSVAFAYLQYKRADNYAWVLATLRDVMDGFVVPTVIVTDRELALMNAIQKIFPSGKHLLCHWHISKNVLTKCKKMFETQQKWEKFNHEWNSVVYSSSEIQYEERLKSLLKEFSSYPDAVKYVMDTWLVPYKDKFVAAWTDTCMHCGNVTTNRAESAHAKLKRQLGSCQVSFQASFEKIHSLLELQHTDIKASFEKSLTVVQHQFKPSQFRELRGNVSISALEYLLVESKRANSIGIDVEACGCVLRHTHGLPCAHEIADYIRQDRPIPLATIHSQWRQLHISICKKEEETEVTCHAEVELFLNKFNESDRTMQLELLKKLKEIVYPESTFLVEPEVKPKTRPRDHKKINVSTRRDPCAFELVQSGHDSFSPRDTQITTLASTLQTKKKRPFVKDVAADGNCGFKAIAASIGHTEDDWAQVRRDLLGELHTHKEEYITLYGSYERFEELTSILSYFEDNPGYSHWMTMPDMGHLVASCYNLVLYHLSLQQCLTFLPLRTVPVPQLDRREIAIGFVNGNHFVQVLLQPGHPVPPIATNWRKYRHPCAVDWDDAYVRRIQHFKDIIHDNVATRETFDVVDVA